MPDDSVSLQPRNLAEILGSLLPPEQVEAEVQRIGTELPAMRKRFEGGKKVAADNMQGIMLLLRASENTAAEMADRNWFQQIWGKITGKETRQRDQVRANLARVQTMGICVLHSLMDRQEYLQTATQYLGGRVELLAIDNAKIKAALVGLGEIVLSRLDSLENRVDSVERRLDLIEIFQSGYSPSQRRLYLEITDPMARALVVCADFLQASREEWGPLDLERLRHLAVETAHLAAPKMQVKDIVEWAAQRLGSVPAGERLHEGELYSRLMKSVEPESDESERFLYPAHFLLLRPWWYVNRARFDSKYLQAVVDQLEAYGVDTRADRSPWELVQMLLEEYRAWKLFGASNSSTSEAERGSNAASSAAIAEPSENRFLKAVVEAIESMDTSDSITKTLKGLSVGSGNTNLVALVTRYLESRGFHVLEEAEAQLQAILWPDRRATSKLKQNIEAALSVARQSADQIDELLADGASEWLEHCFIATGGTLRLRNGRIPIQPALQKSHSNFLALFLHYLTSTFEGMDDKEDCFAMLRAYAGYGDSASAFTLRAQEAWTFCENRGWIRAGRKAEANDSVGSERSTRTATTLGNDDAKLLRQRLARPVEGESLCLKCLQGWKGSPTSFCPYCRNGSRGVANEDRAKVCLRCSLSYKSSAMQCQCGGGLIQAKFT